MGSCLSWADKVLPIEFGGGYYRKEKVAEIQYAIVYVKATVEYEANCELCKKVTLKTIMGSKTS